MDFNIGDYVIASCGCNDNNCIGDTVIGRVVEIEGKYIAVEQLVTDSLPNIEYDLCGIDTTDDDREIIKCTEHFAKHFAKTLSACCMRFMDLSPDDRTPEIAVDTDDDGAMSVHIYFTPDLDLDNHLDFKSNFLS